MSGDPTHTVPDADRVLVVVPPPQIAYFHAILEGYDDLAVMRTISPDEGLVEVWVSPGARGEFDGLLAALRAEGIPLRLAREGEDPC